MAIFAIKAAKKRPKSGQKFGEKFGGTQYPDFTQFWNAKKHRTQFRQIACTNPLLGNIAWRTIISKDANLFISTTLPNQIFPPTDDEITPTK